MRRVVVRFSSSIDKARSSALRIQTIGMNTVESQQRTRIHRQSAKEKAKPGGTLHI